MARYYIPSSADESKTSWSYTPGSAIKDNNNGTYTTSNGLTFKNNYTTNTVTPAMSHAIKQAGGNPNDPKAADKYVENMLGRIGTLSANSGQVLTAADVQKELNRLGYKANGAGGDWMTVGSQQFLTGGDEYNKLKNTLNDIGRGNMNIYNGEMMPTQGNIYNYYAAQAGGGNVGYSSYMDAYAKALEQQLSRIDEQKRLAAENADKEKRQAYVAMKLGQKALNEQNAASGLQDSGYSEQSNIALTADYGNNLNTIDANYQKYLNDLAGTYADTALSGAGTLANLAQQDYANRIAAQQYADKMAQQQLENEWYEREWAAKQAQNEQNLAYEQAKTRADAAMNLGLWTPEIEQIYGINQQGYQAYLNEQSMAAARSAASYSSSRGKSAGGGGGVVVNENEGDDGKKKVVNEDEIKLPNIPFQPFTRQQLLGTPTTQKAQNASTESKDSGNWFTNLLNKRDERLQYEDSTDGRAAKLAKNFGLDDATALAIINAADRSGVSYGEAYKQYMLEYGNDSQKKNAGALSKQVDMYIKRY